eukprot:s4776_g4.t1
MSKNPAKRQKSSKEGDPGVGPGNTGSAERRREAVPALLDEVVVGWHRGCDEPEALRLVPKGTELKNGEVLETQSEEISKLFHSSPVAKAHRTKYNWVAWMSGNMYTRDAKQMMAVDSKSKCSCDICGKCCSEILFEFRAFLRKEYLKGSTERRLEPFVAYISKRCGSGLLGQLKGKPSQLKEKAYRLTTLNIDEARAQLENELHELDQEDRQFLLEELERLAGKLGVKKAAEMESVEELMKTPLLRTPE